MTALVSCSLPAAFHIWPEVRIIAGIEASTMVSLGTCRLVIPRSESTIARSGPRLVGRLDVGLDRLPLVAGSSSMALRHSRPLFGSTPTFERVAVLGEQVLEEGPYGVAEDDRVGDLHHRRLQVHREEHALVAGVLDLLGQEGDQRAAAHDRGVDDLARLRAEGLLEHRDGAVGGDVLDA